MITHTQVSDTDDIIAIVKLADEIWNEYFPRIIGQDQVDYMLAQFQSVQAVSAQIESGFEYYLVSHDNSHAGYLAIVPDQSEKKVMISKIYILRESRGCGTGSYLLDFVKQQCLKRGLNKVWLTVNRHNDKTIEWYKRKGFVISDEVKKDIGGGFYMDDFIMELVVDNPRNPG